MDIRIAVSTIILSAYTRICVPKDLCGNVGSTQL